jgi:hypothetical protein
VTWTLLVCGGCAKRQVDSWPGRVNAALAGRSGTVSERERAEYEAGFTNGASMVHAALKAGVRPYRPVLDLPMPSPTWRGAAPDGVQVEPFAPSPEVDPDTGLILYPASGVKSGAYARGQADGFTWALSAIGQSLVRPVPELGFPKIWRPFARPQDGVDLDTAGRTVRILWAPGHLAWAWKERGFPDQRTWRSWGDAEAPAWVGLSEQALWVESRSGRAIALDLESGGILRVGLAMPHAQPRTSDWESYQQNVLREFNAPEFQRELSILRKAAESNEIADLLVVAKRLSGMGEHADREAFGWYLKAAEKGSPEAMLRVGVLYFHGQSAPADKALARAWLERAIQAGQPDASAVLRMLFGGSK